MHSPSQKLFAAKQTTNALQTITELLNKAFNEAWTYPIEEHADSLGLGAEFKHLKDTIYSTQELSKALEDKVSAEAKLVGSDLYNTLSKLTWDEIVMLDLVEQAKSVGLEKS